MRTLAASLVILALTVPGLVATTVGSPPPPTPAAYTLYAAPTGMGEGAGEPSVGVNWNTGMVLAQNFATTLRIGFDDSVMPPVASWTDVTPPNSVTNVDPTLFTDSVTGRTYAGGLAGQCSILAYTDTDGASWTPMGNACASPSFDHETIGGGPWGSFLPKPPTFPRATYYCAQVTIAQCATSFDGGITFAPAVPVQCGYVNPGLHGSVHVTAQGVAVLPFKNCGAKIGFATSTTNGATWTWKQVAASTSPETGFDPDVASTPKGWIYVGYQGGDGHPYATVTKNNGTTFSTPVDVGASLGIVQSTFHEMIAGDDDRAALAFLGSTTAGDAFAEGFTGVWDLYVATTLDAGVTWSTVKVTSDPVQRGWMCLGVTCDTTNGRNLLDFMDAQTDDEGRVVVAFADGCIGACALPSGTQAISEADYLTIARQSCGPSLFASKGNVEGALACVTGPPGTPPPVLLDGDYYMTGVTPTGQTDLALNGIVVGDTLTKTPPTNAQPRATSNAAVLGGSNIRTFYDASWGIAAPVGGFELAGTPVTVRLFVTAGGGDTPATVPWIVKVMLTDAAPTANAPVTTAFANATAALTPTSGPTEILVTFPALTKTLTQGLVVTVSGNGAGEVVTYYDSTSTPSRLVFG